MGLIKFFLDAHCGTILTICIIVVVVAIITHYRLKKVSWEAENKRQEDRTEQKQLQAVPIVRLRSPENEMLHRVFYMCLEMDTILRDLKKTEDWQREKCGEIDIKATNCDIAITTYDIKEDELTEQ